MNKSSQCIQINNWIATLVLLFPFINGAIGVDGASLITLAMIGVLFLASMHQDKYKMLPVGIAFLLLISIIFIISFLRIEPLSYTINYLLYFSAFNVIALFAGMLRVDVKMVIEHSVLVGCVGVFIYWARGTTYENTGIQMGTAYAMIGILFSSIIAILIRTKYKIFAIINVLLVFLLYVQKAPRGIWLSIGFYVAFLTFYLLTKNLNRAKGILVKFLLMGIAVVFIFGFLTNMSNILLCINDYLIDKFNIQVYALWKFSYYLQKGDLLNGRSEIWESAISAIREGGFFGNGIGYFESIMEGGHTHNIVLQTLCEAGIVFFIPLTYMLIKSIYILIVMTNRIESKEYLYFLLLFSYGVVMLFYSSAHWLWVPFWFFVGYFIGNRKRFLHINRGNE